MTGSPLRGFSRISAIVFSFVVLPGLLLGLWYEFSPPHSVMATKKIDPSPVASASVATEPITQRLAVSTPSTVTKPTDAQSPILELGDGRLSIGAVTLERKLRRLVIPAEVKMREGPVEYVLVSRHGKVHEAVFTTIATAHDIHVAALLLGITPEPDLGRDNSSTTVPGESAIVIMVEWDRNGPPARIFLSQSVNLIDPSTKATSGCLPEGAWLYNGSRFAPDGAFAATREASLISIIRDPDALINHPGATRDNDDIHTPNTAKLPSIGHPVRIILQVK